HAYDGDPGDVHLTAAVVSGELWILIADDGRGLSPRRESPGLGLGLAWMAKFSDGLTLMSRASGGLEVRLRFDLLGALSDAPQWRGTPRLKQIPCIPLSRTLCQGGPQRPNQAFRLLGGLGRGGSPLWVRGALRLHRSAPRDLPLASGQRFASHM